MSKLLTRVLLAVLAVALVGCGATTTPTTSPSATTSLSASATTIGLSYIPNVQFAPFYVAQADGAFAPVAATLRHHGANEGLFTAIAAGEEDFLLAGGDEALQARDQGIDLVAVASYYQGYPGRILTKADSGITTLSDLKGHRIGIPGRYGESWFALLVALQSAGLTESDVEIKEIGYTQQAALSTGKVDAVSGFANNDQIQFERAGIEVRALPLTESGEPPLVSATLLTTRSYLDAHPDVVTAVANGMVAGIRATAEDPQRALDVSAEQVPSMDRDAAELTLNATIEVLGGSQATGKLDTELWQKMADFMRSAGLLEADADISAATAPQILG